MKAGGWSATDDNTSVSGQVDPPRPSMWVDGRVKMEWADM